MNRFDTVGPPGRTVKDRGAVGVDLGAPGWEKTSFWLLFLLFLGGMMYVVSPIYTAFSPRRDVPW